MYTISIYLIKKYINLIRGNEDENTLKYKKELNFSQSRFLQKRPLFHICKLHKKKIGFLSSLIDKGPFVL